MRHRQPLLRTALAFAGLGLAVGLADLRTLLAFPVTRLQGFESLPRPLAMQWVADVESLYRALMAWERAHVSLLLLLFIFAVSGFARLLNPNFRLLKSPDENPGRGLTAHLDLPRLFRTGFGVAVSAWLTGMLLPLAALVPAPTPAGASRLGLLLGGLPAWSVLLPAQAGPVALSMLMALSFWLIWGPGRRSDDTSSPGRHHTAAWGLMAGLAALPLVFLLYGGRAWLAQAGQAFSLADTPGWRLLLKTAVLLPAICCLLLIALGLAYRPRPLTWTAIRRALPLALSLFLVGISLIREGLARTQQLGLNSQSLSQELKLPPSPLDRYALILAPGGRLLYSIAPDGSDAGIMFDRIASTEQTIQTTEAFLRRTNYRHNLTFRAFTHLHDCSTLDWQPERSLALELEMLQKAPTPVAAELILERLQNCPINAETRKVLDQLADPARFVWPQPFGHRWLGMAYRRFGDNERALQHFRSAELTQADFRAILSGVSPLQHGVVRGELRIRGQAIAAVRLGLLKADSWENLLGTRRAFDWRHVLASTHTDAAGKFEFRNIPEGDYVLVVTGGGIGRFQGIPTGTAHPGVISLHRFAPEQTLRPINIRFQSGKGSGATPALEI